MGQLKANLLKPFSYFYSKTMVWSGHRHAPYYLAGVSFAESSFFPIPPDVMLISMGLALPKRSWRYAAIATLFSTLGGLLGYVIGVSLMDVIRPYLLASSYASAYQHIVQWFDHRSVGMVILASFTPFPYKIFTITAGAMHMALGPFIMGSILGRGARFFLVSGLLFFTGARLEAQLRRYIDWIGWLLLLALAVGYGVLKCW